MNANRKMSKAEMLRQPKKQTKGGKRKQKMFLRKAIAKKLKVPASSLKGKTFEELIDILDEKKIPLQEVVKEIPEVVKGYDFEDDEDDSKPKRSLEELQDEYASIVNFQSIRSELLKLGITKEQVDKMTEKQKMEVLQKVGAVIRVGEITGGALIPKRGELVETTGEIKRMKTKRPKEPRRTARIIQPAPAREISDVLDAYYQAIADDTDEEDFDFSLTGDKSKRLLEEEEPVEQKYESEKMDDNDRFSDNFFRGVNSYGSFIPNPIVPERRRYRDFSIRADIEEQNRNMRNDPDVLVEPPQNILEQNEILEGPDDVMPEAEVEPENPARVNYEMNVAANNMHSMAQNVFDRNAQRVRLAQRRILGEEPDDDEYGENLEVEMKEELEEKYDPNLLVREDETREESFLNNRARLDKQIEELSLASQSRRNQTRGKQAHYQREAMSRLKATDKMNQMNIDALRQKEIQWKRPTRTYANNSVGLVRQSNRSMALLAHQLLP